jgi:hypothetical protein
MTNRNERLRRLEASQSSGFDPDSMTDSQLMAFIRQGSDDLDADEDLTDEELFAIIREGTSP